jgi:uncharacterized membrane protein
MGKFVYATLLGLVGAAFVHLAIVLLLPSFSGNDIWRQIEAEAQSYEPLRMDGQIGGIAASQFLDPMFAAYACRYDLADGVFSITAPGNAEFWSVAAFDDRGDILFSANDRIAASKRINLAIALPPQIRSLQQTPSPELESAIVAPSDRRRGFVVVRVFKPDPSWEPVVDRFIAQTRCATVPA